MRSTTGDYQPSWWLRPRLVQRHVSLLPPMQKQGVAGEVAGPGLEGGQVATLPLHVASVVPRDECSILASEGNVCAPWHKPRQNTKNAPNFLELRKGEVRRITLPRTWVNSSPRCFATSLR